LAVSGGSDEHGWWTSRLGTQPITPEMVEALRGRARQYPPPSQPPPKLKTTILGKECFISSFKIEEHNFGGGENPDSFVIFFT
jgi:hypothetical protein